MAKSNIPVETLIGQLHAEDWTARCDAVDELVRRAATWALNTLEATLKYRGQLGL